MIPIPPPPLHAVFWAGCSPTVGLMTTTGHATARGAAGQEYELQSVFFQKIHTTADQMVGDRPQAEAHDVGEAGQRAAHGAHAAGADDHKLRLVLARGDEVLQRLRHGAHNHRRGGVDAHARNGQVGKQLLDIQKLRGKKK